MFGRLFKKTVKKVESDVDNKKRYNTIDEILSHFHPESGLYGGYPIEVNKSEICLKTLSTEFKGIIKVGETAPFNPEKVRLIRNRNTSFETKHTILTLRTELSRLRESDGNLRFKLDGVLTKLRKILEE